MEVAERNSRVLVVRLWLPDRPGALGQVASRIGAVRGDQVADLTRPTQCSNLGDALRRLGPQALCALAGHTEATLPLSAIDLYRPAVADPQRIVCVGLNYEEHRVEAGRAKTANPPVFLRLPSSQAGHLQPIVVPAELPEGLDYEGEIAIVIGRGGRRIPPGGRSTTQ